MQTTFAHKVPWAWEMKNTWLLIPEINKSNILWKLSNHKMKCVGTNVKLGLQLFVVTWHINVLMLRDETCGHRDVSNVTAGKIWCLLFKQIFLFLGRENVELMILNQLNFMPPPETCLVNRKTLITDICFEILVWVMMVSLEMDLV